MVFKTLCILVLWTKEASALEGLNIFVYISMRLKFYDNLRVVQINWQGHFFSEILSQGSTFLIYLIQLQFVTLAPRLRGVIAFVLSPRSGSTHTCLEICFTSVVWTCYTFENNFRSKH